MDSEPELVDAREQLDDLNLDEQDGDDNAADVAESDKFVKERSAAERESGKSLLPLSRVQKIIKADEDMMMVQKEAVLLISLATERFMRRFAEANAMAAQREKRTTTQHKDLANVIRRADEYAFLEEMVPWVAPNPTGKRLPKAAQAAAEDSATGEASTSRTRLDHFLGQGASGRGGDEPPEVIMREDGTMVAE